MKDVIIVTGGDSRFFSYIDQALQSLFGLGLRDRADFGILDLGLSANDVLRLEQANCTVAKPLCSLKTDKQLKIQELGDIARLSLRENFPDYKVYVWFDADAWAQTSEFFERLVSGALEQGAAFVRENGAKYRRDWAYIKWWAGNMIVAYGMANGLKVAFKPAINSGIYALRSDCPHWSSWMRYYQTYIDRTGKLTNQHALNAAVDLDKLGYVLLPARCNWICTLSAPDWHAGAAALVEPAPEGKRISVIHLAGPRKDRLYRLKVADRKGQRVTTQLGYADVRKLG